jgi:glycosyltransferase involved in cell wall biosynthesis
VQLVGELPPSDVRAELGRADVLCLPSYDEGLPMAIIESLAVGCPVVATNIAGIPELITDGESGRLIEPGDVEGLAQALHETLTDGAERSSWIQAGRLAVEQHHDQRATLRELVALFGVPAPSHVVDAP